jgi:hypothetical protein
MRRTEQAAPMERSVDQYLFSQIGSNVGFGSILSSENDTEICMTTLSSRIIGIRVGTIAPKKEAAAAISHHFSLIRA